MVGAYVPERGDLVWLRFDPHAGHEQAGRRPALILSPGSYNGKVGLAIACVGLGNPAGFPRFTFGSTELMGGIGMIPMMIGMFAVSEILRYAVDKGGKISIPVQPIGNVFRGMWTLAKKYPKQILRGSALGTLVGALPGAGADIAAWMSYAISKKKTSFKSLIKVRDNFNPELQKSVDNL